MKTSNFSFTRKEAKKLYKYNLELCETVVRLATEKSILKAKYEDLKKATDHLNLQGLDPILNPRPDSNSK
jgi:hypothetical protein